MCYTQFRMSQVLSDNSISFSFDNKTGKDVEEFVKQEPLTKKEKESLDDTLKYSGFYHD